MWMDRNDDGIFIVRDSNVVMKKEVADVFTYL